MRYPSSSSTGTRPLLQSAEKWGLGIVVAIAAAARAYHIGNDSLWLDEGASWWFAVQPLQELWGVIAQYEPNPPLYYSLLKLWAALFGTSEAALRSLSAVASVLTVILVYFIGRSVPERREDGIWVGFVAAGCIALHPIQIRYAQEARAYALLTLSAVAMLLAMIGLLRRPQLFAVPPLRLISMSNTRDRQMLALFVFAAAFAFWMHNTAVLLVGCVIGAFLILLIVRADHRLHALLNSLVLGAVILVLWLPCLFHLLAQLGKVSASFWIAPPDIGGVAYMADFLFGSLENAPTIESQFLAAAVVGLIAAAGALALMRYRQQAMLVLLCAAIALPVSASLLASIFITPIFIPRPLIWTAIPFVVLLSCVVLLFKSNLSRAGCASILVAAFGALTLGSFTGVLSHPSKESWRDVVHLLEEKVGRDDVVLLWPGMLEHPLLYYGADRRSPAKIVKLSPALSAGAERFSESGSLEVRLRQLVREHDVIWFVAKKSSVPELAQVRIFLEAARGAPQTEFSFRDTFYVWSYRSPK